MLVVFLMTRHDWFCSKCTSSLSKPNSKLTHRNCWHRDFRILFNSPKCSENVKIEVTAIISKPFELSENVPHATVIHLHKKVKKIQMWLRLNGHLWLYRIFKHHKVISSLRWIPAKGEFLIFLKLFSGISCESVDLIFATNGANQIFSHRSKIYAPCS